jgi:hypothetical protein
LALAFNLSMPACVETQTILCNSWDRCPLAEDSYSTEVVCGHSGDDHSGARSYSGVSKIIPKAWAYGLFEGITALNGISLVIHEDHMDVPDPKIIGGREQD